MNMGDKIQVDLCDMRNITKHNEGYNCILTGVDCFTRLGFVEKV
jgi:hypothetical protein